MQSSDRRSSKSGRTGKGAEGKVDLVEGQRDSSCSINPTRTGLQMSAGASQTSVRFAVGVAYRFGSVGKKPPPLSMSSDVAGHGSVCTRFIVSKAAAVVRFSFGAAFRAIVASCGVRPADRISLSTAQRRRAKATSVGSSRNLRHTGCCLSATTVGHVSAPAVTSYYEGQAVTVFSSGTIFSPAARAPGGRDYR